ncbi:MAG: TraB/GumN family protein [Rhizobiaceae bacterium]
MKSAFVLADRYSDAALKLLVSINVLFFLSFTIVLLIATGQARAETPACTGRSVMEELAAGKPAELARIEAEAAKVINGDRLLWKIEKEGVEPSYLFGTMHMTDPRVTALTPAAQTAFEEARTVVIETTDLLDKSQMAAALAKQPELMMFTDSTTLTSLLSPEDRAILEKGLAERGIPLASVIKMKPWMLAAMVALPACEMARQASGAPVLDVKLAEEAKADGKALKGLESVTDQLGAMASLPMEFHIRGLVDSLTLGDRMDDIMETMIELYEREQIAMIVPLINAVTQEAGADNSGYADFEQTMITARNATMASHAAPIIDQGGAFIAVGALHLPGPDGVVERLRKAGYTLTPES